MSTQGKHRASAPKILSAGALSTLLLFGQSAPLLANPSGGQVVAGAATIGPAGSTLTINQASNSAIINWQTFSIAGGETTKFVLPNSASATLNRVVGNNLSEIYGSLQSNGHLYLINPAGIVVGATGRIDTAGFVGSTLDVSNDEFLKGGDLHFFGSDDGTVSNAGVISATGGNVFLIAGQVANSGTIKAPQGDVGLAAGSNVLLQQSGDQHLFVQPALTPATGTTTPTASTRTGVNNTGSIQAAAAELKAAGGNAYALAINNSGSIAATGFKKVNGQVMLTSVGGNINNSGTISAKTAKGDGGTIAMSANGQSFTSAGKIMTSGNLIATGKTGGSVVLAAKQVGVTGGLIDVSGKNGGGSALIGGTQPGTGISTIPSASQVYVGPNATIKADATQNGNGGHVVLYAANTTQFYGAISAKGGAQGGNGGKVETSAATLQVTGTVDTTAPHGTAGNWLLDPDFVIINDASDFTDGGFNTGTAFTLNSGSVTIRQDTLLAALQTGDVTINTNDVTNGTDTIVWYQNNGAASLNLTGTGSHTLTLETAPLGQIEIANVNLTVTGNAGDKLNFVFNPTAAGAGQVMIRNSTFNTNGGDFTAFGNALTDPSNDSPYLASGIALLGVSIAAQGGTISLTGAGGFYSTDGTDNTDIAGAGVLVEEDVVGDPSTKSALTTTGIGKVLITGTYDQNIVSNGEMDGVLLSQVGFSTVNGNINVKGTVSTGDALVNFNVGQAGIDEGGSTYNVTGTGSIILYGEVTGGITESDGEGVMGVGIQLFGSTLNVNSGLISITGKSGTLFTLATSDSSGQTSGVYMTDETTINTGKNASLTITGTGGNVNQVGGPYGNSTGASYGVNLVNYTSFDLGANNTVTITGTGGDVEAGNSDHQGFAQSTGVDFDTATYNQGTGGSLTITGTGGFVDATQISDSYSAGANASSFGFSLDNSATITVAGTTTIGITGTAGEIDVADPSSETYTTSIGVNLTADVDSYDSISINSGTGKITITGTAGNAPSLAIGVALAGFNGGSASITTTGGDVSITGTGGNGYNGLAYDPNDQYEPNVGVAIVNNSSITTGGTGALSLMGTGGADGVESITSQSNGVFVSEITNSNIDTSPSAPVLLIGGALTAADAFGTGMEFSGDITAGSFDAESTGSIFFNGESVTITSGNFKAVGTGSTDNLAFDGVDIIGATIDVSQGTGNITINGTALGGNGSDGLQSGTGVVIAQGAALIASSSSTISITGDASTGVDSQFSFQGVDIYGSSLTTAKGSSNAAHISITGTVLGNNTASDSDLEAVLIDNNSTVSSATGNITISGTVGSKTVAPVNVGVYIASSMVVQGGSGTLSITGTAGEINSPTFMQAELDGFYEGAPTSAGIYLSNGDTIRSSGTGAINLVGTGGNNKSGNNSGEPSLALAAVHPNGVIGGTGLSGSSYGIKSTDSSTTTIASTGGGVSLTGSTPGNANSHGNTGLFIYNMDISDSGNGAVTLMGTAGAGVDENVGVVIQSDGGVGETSIIANGGLLTITGQGGAVTGQYNDGVDLDYQTTISGGSGGVTITGTAGSGGVDFNEGIYAGTSVTATGAGGITLMGTGSGSGNGNDGLDLDYNSIMTDSGNISLTGISNTSGVSNNVGVSLLIENIQTGGTGTVTINGSSAGGSLNNNEGINFYDSSVLTDHGNITLTGTAGPQPDQGVGVELYGDGDGTVNIASNTGDVFITGTGGTGNTGPSIELGESPYHTSDGVDIEDATYISGNNVTIVGTGSGYQADGLFLGQYQTGFTPSVTATNSISLQAFGGVLVQFANLNAPNLAYSAPVGSNLEVASPTGGGLTLSGGGNFLVDPDGNGNINLVSASVGNLYLTTGGAVTIGSINDSGILQIDGSSISQTGAIFAADLIINGYGSVDLSNHANVIGQIDSASFSGGFNFYTDPGLVINGPVSGTGNVVIQSINNDLTIGPNGSVSTTGGNISLVTNMYFINNSTQTSNAVVANGGNYTIYSADPSQTVLNGLATDYTQYNASYPASTPVGNGVVYFSQSNTNQNTISSITPQPNQVLPQQPPPPNTDGPTGPTYNPDPVIEYVSLNGNPPLVDSSNIGPGDVAQLDGNGLDNVTNPHAAGTLGLALSGAVMGTLGDAMQSLGDPSYNTDSSGSGSGDSSASNGQNPNPGGNTTDAPLPNQTILKSGDVVQMGGSGGNVQNVPLSQAPQPLQDALSNGVMDNLSGH